MQKYEVIGPLPVRGRQKGASFEHEFTPEQEAALISAGHIKKKAAPKPKPQNATAQPPSGPAAQTPPKEEK